MKKSQHIQTTCKQKKNWRNAGFSFCMRSSFVLCCSVLLLELSAAEKKNNLWLDHPHFQLPAASSKGLSRSSALSRSTRKSSLSTTDVMKFPAKDKRPTPTADFMAGGIPGRQGNVKYRKVPVEVLEEASVARNATVDFGFPLPQGALFDLAQLRLSDGKNELPASITITGKYADNSIRWVMIRSQISLKAGEKKTLFVEFGSALSPRKKIADGVKVEETPGEFVINNGALKAKISKKNFALVQAVDINGRNVGGINSFGTLLVLKDGKRMGSYNPVPRSIRLIESTPEVVTFRVDGDFYSTEAPFGSYVARITFRRNVPGFDVVYTFINTNLRYEFLDIKSMTIGFSAGKTNRNKIVKWQHFKGNADIPANARRVVQLDDKTVSVDGKNIPARIPGGIKFTMADGMEGTVTIADAWKRYPKGFAVEPENNTVQIELLPVLPDEKFGKHLPYYLQFPFCGGAHRMKWGSSFTERLSFRFGKELSSAASGAEADLPVIAILPPEWYASAGVWKGMSAKSLYKGIDDLTLDIFKRNLKRREEHREYGAFNYGDSFGERNMQNWTNNEYDMPHGMFLYGLRTGNREVLRCALAAARHEADVDVVHTYIVPYFIGCNIQHSCAHTGTYGKWSWAYLAGFNDGHSGHVWLRGMVDAWHLFGDGPGMDAAYLVADHLNFSWLPALKKLVQVRDGAWNLIALCEVAASTQDPEYRKGADKIAKYLFDLVEGGPQWYMNRTGQKARGGIATFMCGIILNSLCDYYDLTKSPEAGRKCADFARWIVKEAFAPELGGLFWYDITPLGRSHFPSEFLNALLAPGIMRAGAIVRDEKLFNDGFMAFQSLMMRHVPSDGKSIALHLLFLEDVFQAAATYGRSRSLTFDRDVWRSDLALRQDGTLTTRGRSCFAVKAEKDGAEIRFVWSNYNATPKKTVVKKLTVKDEKGKVILQHKELRPDTMRKDFSFKADKSGSWYFIDAECDGKSMWVIPASKEYTGYHDSRANIALVSNVSTRLTVEQSAGETFRLEFVPQHMGNYGMTVKDTAGNVLFSKKGFKTETKLSGEQNGLLWRVPAVKTARTLVLEVFSGNGAMIKTNIPKRFARPAIR